jgi:hypothetical protein
LSRWKKEDNEITEHALYMREYAKTETGIAYKKSHAEYAKEWRKNNKEKSKATQQRAYQNMRLEALTHYANPLQCACCGENNIVFLSIDHINGNGADHRRELEAELGYYPGGNNLPYWLKKNNWPEGFQILCYNCNFAKRQDGECPHKTGKKNITTDS